MFYLSTLRYVECQRESEGYSITSTGGLLDAEGDERIDSGGAARGDVAREQRDRGEDSRDHGERDWIGRIDAEQHRLEDPRYRDRAGDSSHETDRDDQHPFADGHAQDVEPLGAECDADSDFVRALAKRVRHHTVDADRGEHHRSRRKATEKLERKSPICHRTLHNLIHRDDAVHGNVWSEAL